MKNRLTACLVIINEEKVLDRCLSSIRNVVDEIIIVHDGECSDKSLEIAKKYNAKTFIQPFVGEAEKHRPFCFSKAISEWILFIDADEFLSDSAQKEIPNLVSSKNVDAYSLKWPLWNNYKNEYFTKGPFSKMQRLCLYRKDKMFMIGVSHFHPRTRGVIRHRKDLVIEHKHPYFKFDLWLFKTKVMRWAKLEAEQTVNYKDAPLFNISKEEAGLIFVPILKHPILNGLKEVVHQFLHYIKGGLLISGYLSWKVAVLDLYRMFITHYYIYKYSKNVK